MTMLLSTPRSIPAASGMMLKRSARKFFDAAQAQEWIVRVSAKENYGQVIIEAWDWDHLLDEETRHIVRVTGTFNADSGAYIDHGSYAMSHGYGPNPIHTVIAQNNWDEKLGDAINRLDQGPKYIREQTILKAKRKAEREAKQMRQDAQRASVLAAGDSPLGTVVRQRLDQLIRKVTPPDLKNIGERYAEEKVAEWRANIRLAEHATKAKKLIHTCAGSNGDETFLTPEQAAAFQADRLLRELVQKLSRRWGYDHINEAKADASFIEQFHPRFSGDMTNVTLVCEA
jgi:hypothetical protein